MINQREQHKSSDKLQEGEKSSEGLTSEAAQSYTVSTTERHVLNFDSALLKLPSQVLSHYIQEGKICTFIRINRTGQFCKNINLFKW
uniref:Uncharacterized protein n=1 Tax=Manihot esculenta TaxID=3983 RepID=A0A2C9UQX2_MANES